MPAPPGTGVPRSFGPSVPPPGDAAAGARAVSAGSCRARPPVTVNAPPDAGAGVACADVSAGVVARRPDDDACRPGLAPGSPRAYAREAPAGGAHGAAAAAGERPPARPGSGVDDPSGADEAPLSGAGTAAAGVEGPVAGAGGVAGTGVLGVPGPGIASSRAAVEVGA